ncbi:hypothetical protein F5879DRAFT_920505 [Lentinula edodes]|uniref:uncharacterized protein n=1 Tax=Lentinula edodes TaxID=5353 RepID=UPI001E8EC0A5|nr:uncharacterized protein C8R40DRAFT_1189430 [Lentinula edodes]KAH7875041.1 hypothetical protein C8R40DRAFT_1189430 [Lentinula edodes]KAJ3906592.1 hypothetical protein F5879DRAFT_920505 [Lentinula edodes]
MEAAANSQIFGTWIEEHMYTGFLMGFVPSLSFLEPSGKTLPTFMVAIKHSKINLAAQLKFKREHERSRVMSLQRLKPQSSSSPTPPRATQRPLPFADSPDSPLYPRLSRAPTTPLIYEDDEPSDLKEDEDEAKEKTHSPRCRVKLKRLSASRFPLLFRVSSSPPITAPVDRSTISASNPTRPKPLRRQSGLLVRQGSPVAGSHEAAEDDELAAVLDEAEEEEENAKARLRTRWRLITETPISLCSNVQALRGVCSWSSDADGDYDDPDGGAQSFLEGPGCQPSRAGSHATDPVQLILSASRTASSSDVASQLLASATSSTSIPSRRAKSRSYLYTAEDVLSLESDDADTEYIAARGGPSWEESWEAGIC